MSPWDPVFKTPKNIIFVWKLTFSGLPENNGQHKIKKYASQISLAELHGNFSSESGNYSAGSLNYSGSSLQCSGGSVPSRQRYDKPPPPRRFVRPGEDPSERYSETPGGGDIMRKESMDYLRPEDTRQAESHIYNTANIVCDWKHEQWCFSHKYFVPFNALINLLTWFTVTVVGKGWLEVGNHVNSNEM